MSSKERNYTIDFIRGVATLFIVLIHTTFWSGQEYLSPKISNLSLLIDVPVFMFLAGLSFNYVNSIIKNIKGILIQWKKWCYFIAIYALILILVFNNPVSLKDILFWIVFVFESANELVVVGGSIWFLPMYIEVTIICSIIIYLIRYFDENNQKRDIVTIILMMFFVFLYTQTTGKTFFINSMTSFYSLIYLLGYLSFNVKIKNIFYLLVFEVINYELLLLLFSEFKINIIYLQNNKFPPTLIYLVFSSFSIVLVWFLKDRIKIKASNKLVYIGKNAIFFYFAQGISSSLIYYIYPYISSNSTILKLIFMFISNVVITIIISLFLIYTYNLICKLSRLVLNKINSKNNNLLHKIN